MVDIAPKGWRPPKTPLEIQEALAERKQAWMKKAFASIGEPLPRDLSEPEDNFESAVDSPYPNYNPEFDAWRVKHGRAANDGPEFDEILQSPDGIDSLYDGD